MRLVLVHAFVYLSPVMNYSLKFPSEEDPPKVVLRELCARVHYNRFPETKDDTDEVRACVRVCVLVGLPGEGGSREKVVFSFHHPTPE